MTESLGAGVGLSLSRLVQLQTAAGARCTVLATRRYDTPDETELRRWFGDDATLIVHPATERSSRRQLLWMCVVFVGLLSRERFNAVHLHSSFAGAVGRLLALLLGQSRRVFYSPHGFGFLRRDLSPFQRALLRMAERALAATTRSRLVLVSRSELEVARRHVGKRVDLLPNGIDLATDRPRSRAGAAARPTIAMIGRIAYQKAPWRFAEAARRLGDRADFVWLGYGAAEDVRRWFDGDTVVVSGALTHSDLLARLPAVDVLYFPTLWEAMPLSLIEAQAAGVPAVASDVDGNRDIVLDGRTGLLARSDEQLLEALTRLVDDPELRRRLADGAMEESGRLSDERRGIDSLALYARRARG